jgi:hypothetical protein
MTLVPNSAPAKVFSFVRRNETDKVFAVLNFSDQPQAVAFRENLHHGRYTDYLGGEAAELDGATRIELKPWGYKVFVK